MTRQIIIISTILLIISACRQNTSENKNSISSHVASAAKEIASHDSIYHQNNLKIVRKFAEEFLPDTTIQNGMNKMNSFPDSIIKAFKELRTDRENQEMYLTLIYLKIYRGHLQCCHQSYELRANPNPLGIDSITDPLLFEYNLITKQFDNDKPIELISSDIAYSWVDKNKRLLSFEHIKKEYTIIQTIRVNIEKGLYW